jgi:hypothetical protein
MDARMKLQTLLIWENFPEETRLFLLDETEQFDLVTMATKAAGQHVGELDVTTDEAEALSDAIGDGRLDRFEISAEHYKRGMVDGLCVIRVIICGCLL